MRRTLIQTVLPFVFCLVPLLAAVADCRRAPAACRNFYLEHLTSPDHYQDHSIDILILGLGCTLFARSCCWRGGRCTGAAPASTSGPTRGCRT